MYIQSDDVKERKRQRKVETEVADLKLKLATTQSKNIVLSNREIRLLRYTQVTRPKYMVNTLFLRTCTLTGFLSKYLTKKHSKILVDK